MSHEFDGRWRTFLGVVGVVLVTAGCLGAPGTRVDDPSAVAEQVESRYDRLDGFRARMVQRVDVGTETRTARATIAFDKGDSLAIAYHTGPKAGTVTVVEDPSAKLFAGEHAEEPETSAVVGTVAADLVRENDVVFEGTARLDGRPTAVFSITPPPEAAESRPTRRVWIDAERVVPLRIESTWTRDGRQVRETIRFENVTLGVPNQSAAAPPAGGATA